MKNTLQKPEQRLETLVQSIFNTPHGKELFARMAIMTEYYSNSLIASAQIRNQIGLSPESSMIYFNSQRDFATKLFNCLTHQQISELRATVMQIQFPQKPKEKKE